MKKNTIAAIATGMSQSGIGIIRISGDDSFNIALRIFRHKNGDCYENFESHRVYYGYIFDDDLPIDEVLVLPMKAPRSFTGEDVIEIQCHGGIFLLRNILDLVIKNGAAAAEPGEFTKRAFLNGRIDLSSAEAVMDVISSKNQLSLTNSVKHLKGLLYDKICAVRSSLIYETAYIESALDDPEYYDLTDYPEKLKHTLSEIIKVLDELSDSFYDGTLLHEGIRTVIIGKPNVGKSSFLNMISGEDKAIVTDIPGTTRDIIQDNININGINLNILDTAGIHKTSDTIEKIGIEKTLSEIDTADLIIIIIDGSSDISSDDIDIFNIVGKSNKKSLVLINKCDLDTVVQKDKLLDYINCECINFSTFTGLGLHEFKKFIDDSFVSGLLKYNDEIFISNARQKECLDNAVSSLKNVISSIDSSLPEDFFTIDLTDAYHYLGLIIGEETSDDLINEIFRKFCIGK